MWGYIAPEGPYCTNPSMPLVATKEDEIPWDIEQSSLKIYPNPATGNFILELTGEVAPDKISVDIYGVWVEMVFTTILKGERKHEFSLSERPVGVYFVRVISGDKAETIKIIKQ
ncbi:MAG: T9SS type A sorting domain-containing protein [Bacteroidota bacterium]